MEAQSSIVLELQRLATDKTNDVVDLCRKALLVATKLKLDDFRTWVCAELNGYGGDDPIPKYRHVQCELRGRHPLRGLVPFIVEDSETAQRLTEVPVVEAVGNLAFLIERSNQNGRLMITFSADELFYLMRAQEQPPIEPIRAVGPSQVVGIIDAVRTTILEWALRLEAEGIMGDGLTFSESEKEKAAAAASIHIENLQAGVIGNVAHSTVSQSLMMAVQKNDIESLRKFLRSEGVSDGDLDDLQTALDADPTPGTSGRFGPKVSGWIGKMVSKAATGVWSVSVNVASQLLAEALLRYYGLARS